MNVLENASLKTLNTFGIDAMASKIIHYSTIAELQELISNKILAGAKVLHIGGGSNLLFLNDFDGIILHSEIKYIEIINHSENTVEIKAGAGVIWDDFVAYTVDNELYGIENLSLIPGEVGASAIQNIGAYGVEVCDCITTVEAVNLATGKIQIFNNAECRYGYRESIFKNELKGKFAITSVNFKLSKLPKFNLNYQHLESEVKLRGEVNLSNVRETIIEIRTSKLPDPAIAGNAGSFFMNPVIMREKFVKLLNEFPAMPHYFVSETEEKVPAGWLIDQCGWKGKAIGNAGVHDKQALVLINKGNATGAEIVHLAKTIQQSVLQKFDIEIHPEVNFIG